MSATPSGGNKGIETRINHSGRNIDDQYGFVNCPVYRGSTVIHKSYAQVEDPKLIKFFYGTHGNPTVKNLEDAWTELTGAAGTVIQSSGLAAISLALMTTVKSGDNVLLVDSVYLPSRKFADTILKRLNVSITYYPPMITAEELRELFKKHPNTTVLFLESPGSQTFEIQDVPALSAVAHEFGAATLLDNTWATPIFFDALNFGVDISIEAGTKYLSGHSDLLETYHLFGNIPGNEDCFLALRGLRTLYIRLKEAERRALDAAAWVKTQPQVLRVLHPAFPDCPGHEIWKRDFKGSSGVFSFVLKPEYTRQDAIRMVEGMKLFSLGYSWGGFESLIMLYDCTPFRTAEKFNPGGCLIRVSFWTGGFGGSEG
uniref:Cystathionine beta-lyase n=1 Tax=Angomonas desouzai TaxID=59800 RepID=U5KLF8_9TRYP|nr:cystathionine beta-lyase [Angomonas desouzai]